MPRGNEQGEVKMNVDKEYQCFLEERLRDQVDYHKIDRNKLVLLMMEIAKTCASFGIAPKESEAYITASNDVIQAIEKFVDNRSTKK